MRDGEEKAQAGTSPAMELVGAGPFTPPSGHYFAYIQICAGSCKARDKRFLTTELFHRSTTGAYSTGEVYQYPYGAVLGGQYDEVTGDSSFHAVAYLIKE